MKKGDKKEKKGERGEERESMRVRERDGRKTDYPLNPVFNS